MYKYQMHYTYVYIAIIVGIGVKWKCLQNHVAPDLFYAYRPEKT